MKINKPRLRRTNAIIIVCWITATQAGSTLISDSLRRYGINSTIMKAPREFKRPRHDNKCETKKVKTRKRVKVSARL